MDHLLSLDELRVDPFSTANTNSTSCAPTCVWAPGLVRAIVVALTFWDRASYQYPMIRAMSPAQWRSHVNSNHSDYRRDCLTCVLARGTGRRHRRIHHPDSYVLTADIAGPLKPGLDPTSKGKMGKGLKYILKVAKYIVPKEFIKDVSGKDPPKDDGVGAEVEPTAEERKFGAELFGGDQELAEQPLPPPPGREGLDKGHVFGSALQGHSEVHNGESGKDEAIKFQGDEELEQPLQPPPSREGRFIEEHVPVEPGPLNNEHVPAEPGPASDLRENWESEDDWLKDIECQAVDDTKEVIQKSHGVNNSEELDYDPSFPGDSDGEEETLDREQHEPQPHRVMEGGDCVPPEMTYLAFGVGLPNNLAATVKAAIQDITLYLRAHGLPIYRFHADKGECFNHHFRGWLRDQGIRATWSEPGVPQGNGHAESMVRWSREQVFWDGSPCWQHHTAPQSM